MMSLEVVMFPGLLDANPFLGVHDEHALQQVNSL